MAETTIQIGTATIKDDGFAGLEISAGLGASGNITTNGDVNGGGILLSANQIWSGTTAYMTLDPVTNNLQVDGDTTFTLPVKVPVLVMTNPTGAHTCGEVTLGALTANVTIATTAVQSTSVIMVTNKEAMTGWVYVDTIIPGTSFDITSTQLTDGSKKVWWFIVNQA